MMKVCKTWDDVLWACTKTILFFKVMEKYDQAEESLEQYNFVYGDFYDTESTSKKEIVNWDFPDSCPSDFKKIFDHVISRFDNHQLYFPKRRSNIINDLMMLILKVQITANKNQSDSTRWECIIDNAYENLQIERYEPEDIIYLRLCTHLLITIYAAKRVSESHIEKFNYIIKEYIKYILREEGEASPKLAFYLNFIIGDDEKVYFYSSMICGVVDEYTQNKILHNMDRFLEDLKSEIIMAIKSKVINSEQQMQAVSSNMQEVTQKLKWMFNKGNYTDFYQSVLEIARVFMIKEQFNKLETLYSILNSSLDECEIGCQEFKENGFFMMLGRERNLHNMYIQTMTQNDIYQRIQNDQPEGHIHTQNQTRSKKIRENLSKLLRNPSQNTVLFDFELSSDCPRDIQDQHSKLKQIMVPKLSILLFDLYFEAQMYNE